MIFLNKSDKLIDTNIDATTENNNNISDLENTNKDTQNFSEIDNNEKNIDKPDSDDNETRTDEEKNSPEVSEEETPSEDIEIKNEDANTTNCLALTIQEEHKLVAVKNVFLRSVRMSWKVIVSSITLAIIKLLS